MKAIFAVIFSLSYVLSASAQIDFPDLSYQSRIEHKVGYTNFVVDYERPLQRGRVIFGGLVRYGKPWRMGAGFHNTLSFDQDVFIQGKRIAKGVYHLVAIPDVSKWQVILSTDSNVFAKNKPYEPEREAVRIEVAPEKTKKHYEAATIDLDIANNDAIFTFSWDFTSVTFTINTGTTMSVMTQIRNMMRSGHVDPEQAGDAADFIAYNLTSLPPSAKDTALMLIDQSLRVEQKPSKFRTKRNIYWFSKDLAGYEKVSGEWIAFLRKNKTEDNQEEIEMVENDLKVFRDLYSKKR